MFARYDFFESERTDEILFPLFKKTGKTPVVIGSNVPAWPALTKPNLFIKKRVECLDFGPRGFLKITSECSFNSLIGFFGVRLRSFISGARTIIFMIT